MKRIFLALLLTFIISPAYSKAPVICESQYALCTTAKCIPNPANPEEALCSCTVQSGYSAGFHPCEEVKSLPNDFKKINSRYYPIKQYLNCTNKRAWANCLDSPCVIDKQDPTKAICACTMVENKGEYLVVTNECEKSLCDNDIYSSILTKDLMSNFLDNQDKLPKIVPKVCS